MRPCAPGSWRSPRKRRSATSCSTPPNRPTPWPTRSAAPWPPDFSMSRDNGAMSDEVDQIVAAWQRERPDLDVEPLHVLSRLDRLAGVLGERRGGDFAPPGVRGAGGFLPGAPRPARAAVPVAARPPAPRPPRP